MPSITIEFDDDDSVEAPARWEICSRCEGEGHHSNPAIDGNGITSSEWDEWDEEDRATYMSGGYDITCENCSGHGKVLVVDGEAFLAKNPEAFARWVKREDDRAEHQREIDSEALWERRMLYGY